MLFYGSETDKTELTEENLNRYINNKIRNYKLQDERADRKINSKNTLLQNGLLKEFTVIVVIVVVGLSLKSKMDI